MVVLDFSITPLGKDESLSPYVARCLEIVEGSGLEYRCGAAGTTIEGGIASGDGRRERCMADLARDCDRSTARFTWDYRKAPGRLAAAVITWSCVGHALAR